MCRVFRNGGCEVIEFTQSFLWELLIVTEIIFWLLIGLFLLFRYVLGWKQFTKWMIPIFILTIVIDIYLGWVDYKMTGEFSIFQFIIIIFVVYALTSGLSDFRRLDAYIQRKVAKWKGQPEPEQSAKLPAKYGREHARHERNGWFMHIAMFVLAQVAFFLLFGLREGVALSQFIDPDFYRSWWGDASLGAYRDITLNQLVQVWFVVLVVDGIISLSYTFSPRKEKKTT